MTSSRAPGNCLVLHRAITNAGDFLIRDRSLALLARHRPDLDLRMGEAWRPLGDQFDPETLDSARSIVICGGPGYQRGMYPGVYPLAALETIRAPLVMLALGGFSLSSERDRRGDLDGRSVEFLRWVVSHGGCLGARDLATARMLAANGLDGVVMAGDPGWYDLEWIDRVDYANERPGIAFTPPANPLFHQQALALLRAVVTRAGAGSVIVVFHRGAQATFAEECARLGVETRDITGGAQGFAIYDDVGLHVGYRVHAHLYCTSRATPSYLVAEDSRGSGVLETLGPLGLSGLRPRVGPILRRAWRLAPRVGSQRTTATRRAGLVASRLSRLPDVSGPLLDRIADDKRSGFPGHRAAKSTIGRTYPVMAELLRAIP